jgi:hypothetical protein
MRTTKKRMRTSRVSQTRTPVPNNSLVGLLKAFSKTKTGEHLAYILLCLRYLVITLIVGFCIQYCWNFFNDKWFGGEYHMSLFEATILWVCIY